MMVNKRDESVGRVFSFLHSRRPEDSPLWATLEDENKPFWQKFHDDFTSQRAEAAEAMAEIGAENKKYNDEFRAEYGEDPPKTLAKLEEYAIAANWHTRDEFLNMSCLDQLMPAVKGVLTRKKLAKDENRVEYTAKHYSPAELRKLFGCEQDKLKELLRTGAIRNIRHSSKDYQIAVDDLPNRTS